MRVYELLSPILLAAIWTTIGMPYANIIMQIENSVIYLYLPIFFIYSYFSPFLGTSKTSVNQPIQKSTTISQNDEQGITGQSIVTVRPELTTIAITASTTKTTAITTTPSGTR